MRKSMDRTGRGLVCAPAAWAVPAALSSAAAAPASPGESARLPFAERFHVTRHGGLARAASSSLTRAAGTRGAARGCAAARKGGAGADGRYKRAKDNGRVLIAEPGGRRKEPPRRLALWDGFERLGGDRRALAVRPTDLRMPACSGGRAGVVAYGGDRDSGPDRLSVRAGRRRPYALHHSADPANDAMNPAVTEFGQESARQPAARNTLGRDSAVFGRRPAPRCGGDRLTFRFSARTPGYLPGALFVRTDTRR